jgi:hypothetical protein
VKKAESTFSEFFTIFYFIFSVFFTATDIADLVSLVTSEATAADFG